MRLLVLDESEVLVSVVKRLVPPSVEVETAESFDGAWAVLRSKKPDAVIANLGPDDLPWDALREYCQAQRPPIPVLFESCVHSSPDEAGLGPLNHSATFIQKPYPLKDLKAQIDRLIRTSLGTSGEVDPYGAEDEPLADDEHLAGPHPHHGR